jgi:lipoprotein signal peptidase
MFQNKIKIEKVDIYSFILILFIFTLDRLSKIYVIELIQKKGSEIFIYDFLNFTLNWNTGIAFGFLSFDGNLLYHLVSALILLIIVYLIYLMVISSKVEKIIISLIVGGAIGNLYDRINYYAVPDFIDFHLKNFHWFTFNVADIFISIGIFMMLFKEIFLKKRAN